MHAIVQSSTARTAVQTLTTSIGFGARNTSLVRTFTLPLHFPSEYVRIKVEINNKKTSEAVSVHRRRTYMSIYSVRDCFDDGDFETADPIPLDVEMVKHAGWFLGRGS